ncbi:Uncharacterised protein [Mycobacteroides abscessus subsp. abscessus]|nr:Uncharacterised protein [Mycobacteroides abscessus subsp. abscessus]
MAGLSCLRPKLAIATMIRPPSPPTTRNGTASAGLVLTRKKEAMATATITPRVMPVLVTTSSMVSGRDTPACASGYAV